MATSKDVLLLLIGLTIAAVARAAENRDCVKSNKIWISKEGTEGCENFCENDLSFFPFKTPNDCSDIICGIKGPVCYDWTVKTCLTSTASFARKIKKKVPIPFPESVFSDKCKPVKDLCKALIDQKEDPKNTTYQKIVGNCLGVISLSIVEQDSIVKRLDFGMSKLLGLVSKLQDAAAIFEKVVPQAMTQVKKDFPGLAGGSKSKTVGRRTFNKFNRTKASSYGQGDYTKNFAKGQGKWDQWGATGGTANDQWGAWGNTGAKTGGTANQWGTGSNTGGSAWGTGSNTGGSAWGTGSGTGGSAWGTGSSTGGSAWGTGSSTGGSAWGTGANTQPAATNQWGSGGATTNQWGSGGSGGAATNQWGTPGTNNQWGR